MTENERYRRFLESEGTDRFRRLGSILEAVALHGSLNRATSALGISYRQAWGLLRKAEEQLGAPLLTRRVGGAEGGGAELTDTARELLARYRRLQTEVAHILTTPEPDPARPILIASTIGPVEVGLLDSLEAAFNRATGLWVRHIAAGSGQAMEIARAGRVDLLLTHSPTEEERFIVGGWGLGRHPLMGNQFLICGPDEDPARVRSARSAAEAMSRIAGTGSLFLSRGDQSGTHRKELALWEAAGVVPQGSWHRNFERGAQGTGITLREADRLGAYTLADRATFAMVSPLHIKTLWEQDPLLANPFSLITLNPERFPQVNQPGAGRFVSWATGPGGREVIANSGYFDPLS